MICTTVNVKYETEIFSRADYVVLIKDGKIVYKEENPALHAKERRPAVAKRCMELGAQVVVAPHGSLCLPSYMILSKSGKAMYVVKTGEPVQELRAWPINAGEVAYSSLLAVWERINHG